MSAFGVTENGIFVTRILRPVASDSVSPTSAISGSVNTAEAAWL